MKLRLAAIVFGALLATIDVACLSKPPEPHLGGGPDARGIDSPSGGRGIDAPMPGSCGTSDNFDANPSVCGSWGTAEGGVVTRSGGVLTVLPMVMGNTNNGCITNQPFDFTNGASIEIPQILGSGGMTYTTELGVYSDSTKTTGVRVTLNSTTGSDYVQVLCVGGPNVNMYPAYDALAHRWWRVTKSTMQTGALDVSSGSDGVTYTLFTTCPVSFTGNSVIAELGAYSPASADAQRPAQFDHFNTNSCPPPP